MWKNEPQSGHIFLELVVLLVLASGAYLFWDASKASNNLIENENQACTVLRAIALAQDEFNNEGIRLGFPGFGTLGQLMGLSTSIIGQADIGNELRRELETAEHVGAILANDSYCFTVFVVDQDGYAHSTWEPGVATNPGFWIAYAWPRKYGESARRVFAIDSFHELRSWVNQSKGHIFISGINKAPPAHLAPPPEGKRYPFAQKPQGMQRTHSWIPE